MNNDNELNSLRLGIPDILLPKSGYMSKWPVIACDQYTQDRGYWKKVKDYAGDSPSTINLIFPEIFLNDADADKRIIDIHSDMNRYLKDGVFNKPFNGFIYIERDTPYQKKRRGLVAAIDLEHYDWHPDARPLIRCTEGTVPERLPPRMDIRRGAPLELPHTLLLIDDDKDELLPVLGEIAKKNDPVYDTRLMMDSGRVTGWHISAENDGKPADAMLHIVNKLDELSKRSITRYGAGNNEPFLFAVGDGNHSLAAAKGIWNEIKNELISRGEEPTHPCRFALAEIENIYDPAIQFEPIHRLIFDIGFDNTITLLSTLPDFSYKIVNNEQELSSLVSGANAKENGAGNIFGVISKGRYALIKTSASGIATACLQPILDEYQALNMGTERASNCIDYIHDEKELFRLSAAGNRGTAGILLPPVEKSGLFDTVARLGPLPRKSFSMGHSREKRFYLECRRINN
ncbi:MAG: DUF1015 domain-containing protein [Treponema sp.]|nr:DUF1015 domain-containing protein [Treponema sp.]